MLLRRRALVATAALMSSSVATLGRVPYARADDRATAQQLFLEGKALMKAGNVAAACPKFEGAAQLSSTPGVRLNLADCWATLGHTASAWAKYNEAVAVAERIGDAVAADDAKQARAALIPMLSYLTVVVPPAVAAQHIELTRDGEALPSAAWNTSVPVDPGTHTLVARARGRKPWTATLEVAPRGDGQTVTLTVLAIDPAATATAETQSNAGSTQRTVGWVTGAVGVVGLGVGTYFGIDALTKKNDYQTHVGSSGSCLDLQCQTLSHDSYVSASAANVAFVAGGVLVASGVALWLTAPSRKGKSTSRTTGWLVPGLRAQVSGTALPHGAGVAVVGGWL